MIARPGSVGDRWIGSYISSTQTSATPVAVTSATSVALTSMECRCGQKSNFKFYISMFKYYILLSVSVHTVCQHTAHVYGMPLWTKIHF